MKRMHLLAIAIAVAAALVAMPALAFAESFTGASDWTVTFNSSGSMDDTFSAKQWADDVGGLQPGDDITFTVTMKHENASDADWYMSNEVLKSLEEGAAEGSAYGYYLTYTGPSGEARVLYDSDTVGGTSSEGLNEATSGLEDYLYLDRLSNGDSGHMTLKVSLDGETEGNAYFNTLAQLKMRFAVELANSADSVPNGDGTTRGNAPRGNDASRDIVRTGDEGNLFPFYVALSVSGILLSLIATYMVMGRKREREQQGR